MEEMGKIILSKKHKLRLFLGIHGSTDDGYCFHLIPKKILDKFPVGFRRFWYNKVMFRVLSPLLNRLIGFKPDDWKV